VATLGDYIRHLQEVDKQSNQSCVACVSPESKFDHICPNNPILTCNCTDPKFCAELGNDPDRQYRDTAGNDGFADNIDYAHIKGRSISVSTRLSTTLTAKGQSTLVGWPCVIVGAFSETWTTAAECVPGREHSAGHTEQHTDAGLNNDEPAATTGL
jgi:hypothetical protein